MFEPNQYRELCSELHVSEEKLEEVIQMTEQEKKRKFHRPMRLGRCNPGADRPRGIPV